MARGRHTRRALRAARRRRSSADWYAAGRLCGQAGVSLPGNRLKIGGRAKRCFLRGYTDGQANR